MPMHVLSAYVALSAGMISRRMTVTLHRAAGITACEQVTDILLCLQRIDVISEVAYSCELPHLFKIDLDIEVAFHPDDYLQPVE